MQPGSVPADIADRKQWYIEWIAETFGRMPLTLLDGRNWSLNHARLVLGIDLDQANEYFASVPLTVDRDFMGIRLLKTLLDFQDTGRLQDEALAHLRSTIADWEMNDPGRIAFWPASHTENHDIMFLTIAMFSQLLRGEDIGEHVRQACQSLAWRFERGWVEWNSPRYGLHYFNPLLVLADHAPAERLREGAQALVNLQLAERALLSVDGYLAGPFFRSWDRHRLEGPEGKPVQRGPCAYFDNNRYDAYLPNIWLAFGLAEPWFDYSKADVELVPAGDGYGCRGDARLNQDEGLFLAASPFEPHPIVQALAADAATRPELVYRGTRGSGWPPHPLWGDDPKPAQLYYYNTPHISMGSLQCFGWSHQTRYCSVMFAAEPAQNLRIDMILPGVEWDRWRQERRGELAQHRGWLLGRGELVRDGRIEPELVDGPVSLYRVGRGLAAHVALDDGYQVIEVSDLDKCRDEADFLARFRIPKKQGHIVSGVTLDGDQVAADVRDMSVEINGEPRGDWTAMLHDSEPMRAQFGAGAVHISTSAGDLTLDNSVLQREIAGE